jgi:predicted nucleotidyltransferase
MPPLKVELAAVEVMLRRVASTAWSLVEVPDTALVSPPPVMVSPLVASERPAADMLPVSTVEVPATVERMFPPVIVMPFEEVKLKADIPPVKVEVAVVVATMPGTVDVP